MVNCGFIHAAIQLCLHGYIPFGLLKVVLRVVNFTSGSLYIYINHTTSTRKVRFTVMNIDKIAVTHDMRYIVRWYASINRASHGWSHGTE